LHHWSDCAHAWLASGLISPVLSCPVSSLFLAILTHLTHTSLSLEWKLFPRVVGVMILCNIITTTTSNRGNRSYSPTDTCRLRHY
jgi:hypothetical protein